ncbi:MAG: SurA N-terminal domain-containing protein [Pedosphaera sp.]|nr:SurA N-terminal domain-containing protein [Pedosphaera sp.]
MFGTVRKHSQPLWIVIIIMVVISFVVYFTPGYDPFENQGGTATEADVELSFARGQVLLEQALNMSQQFGGFLPPTLNAQAIAGQFGDQDLNRDGEVDVSGLDYAAHMRLLRLRKAASLGIIVSDNMVKARLEQMFSNPNDQKFSQDAYTGFLTQYRNAGLLGSGKGGEEQFQELIREQITFQQLDNLMTRSVGFFADEATADQQAMDNKLYTAQAVFFSTSNRTDSVTNFASIATNFYQKVHNDYFIQPKRQVAYVLFPVAPYLEDAEKEIKLDDLVKERVDKHMNSTNSVDHFTDANGTKLVAGAALDAAALADIRKAQQPELDAITLPKAKAPTTKFRKALFERIPREDWTTAQLYAKAKAQGLEVQSAIVDRDNAEALLPQALVDAAFGLNLQSGQLSTSDVKVPGEGYYVWGLEKLIEGRRRNYEELTDEEKAEVKEAFIAAEVKKLASEEGNDYRDTLAELTAEGESVEDLLNLSKQTVISLPAMTLSATDVNATALEGLATVTEIQSVIGNLERENRSLAKPNWLSSYNPASTEGVGGFIVHVSKVEDGAAPSTEDLRVFADQQRNMARNFNSSFTAARFGMTPVWLRRDVEALNQQLIVAALQERLNNIAFDIEQATEEISELEKIVEQAKSNPSVLQGVSLEEIQGDLAEAKFKLQQLEELQTTLPEQLKAAQTPAGS